ncbi:MAG: biotin attachment protein [Bacillota bacterium]|nr:biotin attachment protein [Bacillota bacterium]
MNQVVEVRIPEDLWKPEEAPQGVRVIWLREEGARVERGETIAELAVEKVQYEIEAPAGGRLRRLLPEEEAARPGAVIAAIEKGA